MRTFAARLSSHILRRKPRNEPVQSYKNFSASSYGKDERRMKIIEMGGAEELVKMLEAARDDRTRKEALKALFAISKSVEAAAVLHRAGAIPAIKSTPSGSSPDDSEVEKYKSHLLNRFHDLRYDATST